MFCVEMAHFTKCFQINTYVLLWKDDSCLSMFIGPSNLISFPGRKQAADNLLLMCRFDVNVS